MRKIYLSLTPLFLLTLVFLLAFLSGCANVMTGMTSLSYQDTTMVLAYSGSEVIRDQNQVATLIVPNDYGVTIDGVLIKERDGQFNSSLRKSAGSNSNVYTVDVPPGSHNLSVTYNAAGGEVTGGNPQANMQKISNRVSVGGSYSGPSLIKWIRTSDTTHQLKGGDVYLVGLKMMTITGAMDIYALGQKDRAAVDQTRRNAQF